MKKHNRIRVVLSLLFALISLTITAVANATPVVPGSWTHTLPSIELGALDNVIKISQEKEHFIYYMFDAGGKLSIDDIRSGKYPFKPVDKNKGGGISFGYVNDAVWLVFRVFAPVDAPFRRWILDTGYPTLDRVSFYLDYDDTPLEAGDRMPFSSRMLEYRNPAFPLLVSPGETRTVYMRIQTEGSMTMPLVIYESRAFFHHAALTYAIYLIYFGGLLAMVFYNSLLFFVLRIKGYLIYVMMLIGMAFAQMSYSGMVGPYLWPDANELTHWSLLLSFPITGLFSAEFTREFLQTRFKTPKIDIGLRFFSLLFLLICLSALILPYGVVIQLVLLAGVLFSLYAIFSGLYASFRINDRNAGIYVLSWSFILGAVTISGVRHLGLIDGNIFIDYSMLFGSAIEMVMLSFGLSNMIQTLREEKNAAERQVEQERIQSQLKSQEQLRASNERLNIEVQRATSELRFLAHYDRLTGLANRLLLEETLSNLLDRAQRSEVHFGLLLIDINGFKPVNDTWGHNIGDDLLVAIARRIQAHVRRIDTVARMGGDEFIIILNDVKSLENTDVVANALTRELSLPFYLGDLKITVGGSIGAALYPDDGKDMKTLIRVADQRMYAKKSSNKTISD